MRVKSSNSRREREARATQALERRSEMFEETSNIAASASSSVTPLTTAGQQDTVGHS